MRTFWIPVPTSLRSRKKLTMIAAGCWVVGSILTIIDGLFSNKMSHVLIGILHIPVGLYFVNQSLKKE